MGISHRCFVKFSISWNKTSKNAALHGDYPCHTSYGVPRFRTVTVRTIVAGPSRRLWICAGIILASCPTTAVCSNVDKGIANLEFWGNRSNILIICKDMSNNSYRTSGRVFAKHFLWCMTFTFFEKSLKQWHHSGLDKIIIETFREVFPVWTTEHGSSTDRRHYFTLEEVP